MSFLDHQGESEFPFNKKTVFEAMVKAIPTVKGLKIDSADELQGRIVVKAGISWSSWGENIPIQLSEVSEKKTTIKITSSPKTGILGGGALDFGKNKKNIELILSATSSYLSTGKLPDQEKTAESQAGNSWYDNKLVVHLLLVFLFPIGVYGLWKTDTVPKWWKIVGPILVFLLLLILSAE